MPSHDKKLECWLVGAGARSYGRLGIEHSELVLDGKTRLAIPLSSIRSVSAATGVVTITCDKKQICWLTFDRTADAKAAARIVETAAKAAVPAETTRHALVIEDKDCFFTFGPHRGRGRCLLTTGGMELDGPFRLAATCSAIAGVKLIEKTLFVTFRVSVDGARGVSITPRKSARRWLSVIKTAAASGEGRAMTARVTFRKARKTSR